MYETHVITNYTKETFELEVRALMEERADFGGYILDTVFLTVELRRRDFGYLLEELHFEWMKWGVDKRTAKRPHSIGEAQLSDRTESTAPGAVFTCSSFGFETVSQWRTLET